MRRVVSWMICVALIAVAGCGGKIGPHGGPACTAGYTTSVVVLGGHRYLYIVYPDGRRAVMNLDKSPQPGDLAVPEFACPCELPACSEMCAAAESQLGLSSSACVLPPVSTAAPARPQPAAPEKSGSPK